MSGLSQQIQPPQKAKPKSNSLDGLFQLPNSSPPNKFFGIDVPVSITKQIIAQLIPEPVTNALFRKVFWIENEQIPLGVTLIDHPAVIELVDLGDNKIRNLFGFDVSIYDDTATLLNYEMESFNNSGSNDSALLHVKLPIARRFTQIQVVYGDESAADQSNKNGVWTSKYQAAYLMNQLFFGNTSTRDSTSNNNHSIAIDGFPSPISAPGQVNGAVDMRTTETKITLPNSLDANITNTVSILGWTKARSFTDQFNNILTNEFTAQPSEKVRFVLGVEIFGGTANRMGVGYFDGSNWQFIEDSTDVDLNQDIMWTGIIRDGNKAELYRDSVLVSSGTLTGTMPAEDGTNFFIGHRHDSSGHWNGIIDNLLITNDRMSEDFIKAYFNNTNAPNTFWGSTPELVIGEPIFEVDNLGNNIVAEVPA